MYKMNSELEHVMHATGLGVALYFAMIYLMKQSEKMAMSRSVLIAGLALVYMVLYGHKLPSGSVNPNLGF